jgi:hypothetical protein
MINIDSLLFAADIDMVSAGIVGLIALAVVVFAIMSAKDWHWVNVVFLILTLLSAIAAIVGMTKVFDHRRSAMIEADKATKQAVQRELELQQIKVGDPLSPQYDDGSLRALSSEYTRVMTGRGRVYRGGQISAQDQMRKFKLADGKKRQLDNDVELKGAILYAFAETSGIPVRFIGAVQVVAETEDDFTLQPVALADVRAYAEPSTTWALFEKMPQDERGIFRDALIAEVDANENAPEGYKNLVKNIQDPNEEFDITSFRIALRELYLKPATLGVDQNSAVFESLLDRFSFDGQSLGTIEKWIASAPNRKSDRFEPSPEEVFVKYVFTTDAERPITVDGVGVLENDGMFDNNGLAIYSRLRQEGEEGVKFKKGDTVFVDLQSALGYQREGGRVAGFSETFAGAVEEKDRIYRRQLNDFPLMFKNLRLLAAQTAEDAQKAAAANDTVRVSYKDAQAQIRVRADLIAKSSEDTERLEADLATINASNQAKQAEIEQLGQRLEGLRTNIDGIYQRLKSTTVPKANGSAVSTR